MRRRAFLKGVAGASVALGATGAIWRPRRSGRRVAVLGGGCAGMSAAHELAERGFEVAVYEKRAVPGGKCRSIGMPGTGVGGRADLPGEHGFRFFPGYYRHVIDTMERIPFGTNRRGVRDNLVSGVRAVRARARRTSRRRSEAGMVILARRAAGTIESVLRPARSEAGRDHQLRDPRARYATAGVAPRRPVRQDLLVRLLARVEVLELLPELPGQIAHAEPGRGAGRAGQHAHDRQPGHADPDHEHPARPGRRREPALEPAHERRLARSVAAAPGEHGRGVARQRAGQALHVANGELTGATVLLNGAPQVERRLLRARRAAEVARVLATRPARPLPAANLDHLVVEWMTGISTSWTASRS
jgi:glycine/D-amino acid oxidase-like deaminating enzyme